MGEHPFLYAGASQCFCLPERTPSIRASKPIACLASPEGVQDGPSKERAYTMLPKEAIDEYKVLYKKRFGVDLSDAEASFRANNLVSLYRAVLGPERPNNAPEKEPRP